MSFLGSKNLLPRVSDHLLDVLETANIPTISVDNTDKERDDNGHSFDILEAESDDTVSALEKTWELSKPSVEQEDPTSEEEPRVEIENDEETFVDTSAASTGVEASVSYLHSESTPAPEAQNNMNLSDQSQSDIVTYIDIDPTVIVKVESLTECLGHTLKESQDLVHNPQQPILGKVTSNDVYGFHSDSELPKKRKKKSATEKKECPHCFKKITKQNLSKHIKSKHHVKVAKKAKVQYHHLQSANDNDEKEETGHSNVKGKRPLSKDVKKSNCGSCGKYTNLDDQDVMVIRWICCSNKPCSQWYHQRCVNVEEGTHPGEYFCKLCRNVRMKITENDGGETEQK